MCPTIVSYATPGAYELELERLAVSCAKFELPLRSMVLPPRGSWAKNCAFKPQFIRERLAAMKQPIVWLDADAEVVANPIAFSVLECDMAAVRITRRSGDLELLTGTLFFRPTTAAHRLLDHWAAECNNRPEVWDQKHLQRILPLHHDLDVHWLPESYAFILEPFHDRDRSIEPVIVHHQASRRLKREMKGVVV